MQRQNIMTMMFKLYKMKISNKDILIIKQKLRQRFENHIGVSRGVATITKFFMFKVISFTSCDIFHVPFILTNYSNLTKSIIFCW